MPYDIALAPMLNQDVDGTQVEHYMYLGRFDNEITNLLLALTDLGMYAAGGGGAAFLANVLLGVSTVAIPVEGCTGRPGVLPGV